MENSFFHLLDRFFLIFHTLFTLFNISGWLFRRTRRLHFATMMLTLFSWAILGIWHGFGYCFCTDWHWRVREALGKPVESWSYIHFLIKEITTLDLNPVLVDRATLSVFFISLLLTVVLNVRDRYYK